MHTENARELGRVVQMVDQVVEHTIELMVHQMNSPEQLVLNVTREQALKELRDLLQFELSSQDVSSMRVWRIVSAILATCLAYVVESLDDSISYQLCRVGLRRLISSPLPPRLNVVGLAI